MGIQLRRVASKKYGGNTTSESCLKRNILRIQFCRIASKIFLYNMTPEICLEGNILRIQLCKIASKEMFWEYNFVELPQRESIGIQLRKVAPKGKCGNTTPESCLKWSVLRIKLHRVASKGSVGIQLRRVASKKILLDATSTEFTRKRCFDDIDSGSQFWSWIFYLGSYFISTRGRFFIFIFLNLDDDSESILDFQLRVKFWFSWWWLRVKIHLHLLSVHDFRSRISFFCTIWGQCLIFDWWLGVRN